MANIKTIGITLGDANGIGPEITLKAVSQNPWSASVKLVLIGSKGVIKKQATRLRLPMPPSWNPASNHRPEHNISYWDPTPGPSLPIQLGHITAKASQAAALWIESAVYACQQGWLDAMVTGPICKEGLKKAGIAFPGHTEMLAKLTHTQSFAMMLLGEKLRVILATRHIPICQVPTVLSRKNIYEAIEFAGKALPWMGLRKARIGVCGLNPHAGDGGVLGQEEKTLIEPAIRKALKRGFNVTGPLPADTAFHQAYKNAYDLLVCMYHDQGLGPLKMIAFETGVNITLGLPIIRTSPDHGTAFDIAGKNKANASSMVEAVRWAIKLSRKANPWAV